MKHNLYALLFLISTYAAHAQPTGLRGLYIDSFIDIIGNSTKEDSLLHYAQDSSFNYMAMYDLHLLNLSNPATADLLGAFIKRAKENFGIQYVGAVGESYSSFKNKIGPFNNSRSDDNEKFNVFNLEFEFWTTSSVNPGGYYCLQYLQPNNCSCDTSGGFKFFIEQIHKIDSLAEVQQVISETYLGWFNQGQGSQIQQNVDRILLHAYRTGTSSLFGYSKTRLQHLASNNVMVDIAPIFSAEPDFMGPWLETHPQLEAYSKYKSDFDNDNSAWKQYINVLGYHWFDWGFMPKPPPGPFSPNITASGLLTFCAGNSITLTATSGDSYDWSNGTTTRTITVSSSGNYWCDVTLNNVTASTPVSTVDVKNKPIASITQGNNSNGQLPLFANASPGSGYISSYQWKINNIVINGANQSTFISVASGDYSVVVTNNFNCSTTSSINDITFSGNCFTSTPSGLVSSSITEVSELLNWDSGQTGDSLIVRYYQDNWTEIYNYERMLNIGQNSIQLSGLQQQTNYGWEVYAMCGNTPGTFSIKGNFTTGAFTNIDVLPDLGGIVEDSEVRLKTFPNPVSDMITIEYESDIISEGEIKLIDVQSRIILTNYIHIGKGINKYSLNLSEFGSGLYFLSFKNDNTTTFRRLILGH